MAGSSYKATAAALGPAMRALSTSTGLGFAHFGALAGVGKGQRAEVLYMLGEEASRCRGQRPGYHGQKPARRRVFAHKSRSRATERD